MTCGKINHVILLTLKKEFGDFLSVAHCTQTKRFFVTWKIKSLAFWNPSCVTLPEASTMNAKSAFPWHSVDSKNRHNLIDMMMMIIPIAINIIEKYQ